MTVKLLTFYDSAWPPASPPTVDGVCAYIGGDTPHVWTLAEVQRQRARYRLPVWVRSDPAAASWQADSAGAIAALHRVGCPRGSLVALDVEIAVDAAYVRSFSRTLATGGYPVILYGSDSTVFQNHIPDRLYFAADWTGAPHMAAGAQMTQYVNFRAWDLDLALSTLPFWDTRPTAPQPTLPNWQETMMHALPVVAENATGPAVRTIQGLIIARGYGCTVDGVYGPSTAGLIRTIQNRAGLAVDGVTGPKTWPVLMGIQ
jgi:hypothetical protein